MVGIVGMAFRGVATEICLIVCGAEVHIDLAVPMVSIGVGCLVEQLVIFCSRKAAARGGLLHAVTDDTGVMQRNIGNIYVSKLVVHSFTIIIRDFRCGPINGTVRGIAVAFLTIQGEIGRLGVAVKATDSNSIYSVKIDSMTQGTRLWDNVSGNRVMEGCVGPGPIGRMSVIFIMTATCLTTGAVCPKNSNVKAGVAAGAAGLAVADLAVRHPVRKDGRQTFRRRPVIFGIEE